MGECLDEVGCSKGLIITWGELEDTVAEDGRKKILKAVNWLLEK